MGLLVSVPLVAGLVGWAIPTAIGSILGGARDLDDRLRAKDAYLTVLCESGQDYERDAELCACVFSMEFPSLDCQHAFNLWALERQAEACADSTAREQSLSFCTCVQTVDEAVQSQADEGDKRQEAQRYENCEALEDVLPLPEVEGVEQPMFGPTAQSMP